MHKHCMEVEFLMAHMLCALLNMNLFIHTFGMNRPGCTTIVGCIVESDTEVLQGFSDKRLTCCQINIKAQVTYSMLDPVISNSMCLTS